MPIPIAPLIALIVGMAFIPICLKLARGFCLYAIVQECEAQVFTLFGKVMGTLDTPGLHFPVSSFGMRALLLPMFGKRYTVSTALRQNYLRGQMVNSEEGTPMGVGIWYEMQVVDPVAYLFKNTNPDGSLEANVASSTISTLSNLEMEKMLEDRHSLSRTVRSAVSPLSEKWGYRLGSVYIRKVAFTDRHMVDNITEKVVKRLVQVTSAMKQDGDNRVGLIRSQTANKVSKTMAEASASRPRIVGAALNAIASNDKELLGSVLELMETQQLLASDVAIELVPADLPVLYSLAEKSTPRPPAHPLIQNEAQHGSPTD